jgi:hypothetical protein
VTRLTLPVSAVFALVLVGCTGSSDPKTTGDEDPPEEEGPQAPADSDGDGLSDDEEAELGSDPQVADTDGDGLGDLEERDLGANPTTEDSDGDTYRDGDEVAEGHSPTDPEDRIYVGYWPYNPNKDAISDPGLAGNVSEVGGTMPRLQWPDQHGQVVDLYDFAGQGKLTVVDLSGGWCYWCHELADWLEYIESDYDLFGYDAYEPIRAALASGDLQWITVLDGNALGGPATENTITAWYEQHPFEQVPVLLDANYELLPWFSHGDPWFYPSYVVMDENMELLLIPSYADFGEDIFPALTEMLEAQ